MTAAAGSDRSRAEALEAHQQAVARELRRRALHGLYDGDTQGPGWRYLRHCTVDDSITGVRLIFTRDVGHHTSGWLKNPDYERCWHLSTSPRPLLIAMPGHRLAEPEPSVLAAWVRAFYGQDLRRVWAESPKNPQGRSRSVWHWRLFCDEHWQPVVPRKEVYSLDFTEIGWQSASQVLAERGAYTSETVAGRTIVSTVDPR